MFDLIGPAACRVHEADDPAPARSIPDHDAAVAAGHRLLQLSTLDLQREIQEALDSNFMLEESDEADRTAVGATVPSDGLRAASPRTRVAAGQEQTEDREVRGPSPPRWATNSRWTVSGTIPSRAICRSGHEGGEDNADYDPFAHRGSPLTLHDHLLWQLNLSRLDESDRAIATAVIDAISLDGYLRGDR